MYPSEASLGNVTVGSRTPPKSTVGRTVPSPSFIAEEKKGTSCRSSSSSMPLPSPLSGSNSRTAAAKRRSVPPPSLSSLVTVLLAAAAPPLGGVKGSLSVASRVCTDWSVPIIWCDEALAASSPCSVAPPSPPPPPPPCSASAMLLLDESEGVVNALTVAVPPALLPAAAPLPSLPSVPPTSPAAWAAIRAATSGRSAGGTIMGRCSTTVADCWPSKRPSAALGEEEAASACPLPPWPCPPPPLATMLLGVRRCWWLIAAGGEELPPF